MIPTSRKAEPPGGGAVDAVPNPALVTAPSVLQVALIWRGKILGYRLIGRSQKVTVGAHRGATFITPAIPNAPKGFTLLVPTKPRGHHRLRLAESLRGDLTVGGEIRKVADLLRESAGTAPAVELVPGDKARLTFEDAPGLRLEIRYVEPAPSVPRPRLAQTEPFLMRVLALTSATLLLAVAGVLLFAPDEPPRALAISAERMAKLLPPAPPLPLPEPVKKGEPEKEKAKEPAGQTKKAKEKQGKIGHQDAPARETTVPKGEKDILREKVANKGLLGIIGKERPEGSGLSKLFANDSLELEQAVAGMKGATLAVGRGAGGLSTTGAGVGGGGTGAGHIYGAGELNTGGRASRGKGRGPVLAARAEREVSVGVGNGSVDDGGGLSKEQVAKVVRAHQNAIKFCYEKELQRKPTLGGKVEVFWVIAPDGTVEKSKIAASTMGDDAVEGCIVRQVKQWAFPRSDGRTVVQSFPFLFKGGV